MREYQCRYWTSLAVIDGDVYALRSADEWSDVIDWSRAFGGCANGHTFVLEAACYLHSDHDQETRRLTDQCRLADDDVPYQGGYVACPHCDQHIEFTA